VKYQIPEDGMPGSGKSAEPKGAARDEAKASSEKSGAKPASTAVPVVLHK
jgi:hypothetical protein